MKIEQIIEQDEEKFEGKYGVNQYWVASQLLIAAAARTNQPMECDFSEYDIIAASNQIKERQAVPLI